MKKESIRRIENHIVAAIIAIVIVYLICSIVYGYDVPGGILSPLIDIIS
ncbi:hypothetical protein [uncultured Metabacillus sp.]|nr:hypothetical protein [uncultured Metabacillus sp.]